ncbi:hypothetical protein B0J14DRAFT_609912 [Halenospora varia]|nr:hypothetical protein B0J14DRAFT_609912 [Halenospora varia]
MKLSSSFVCVVLAASAVAAPVAQPVSEAEVRTEIIEPRDVDVAVDGKAVHIEGGYIRNTDLERMGMDVADRDANLKTRQEHVDGVALRSGWGYIKPREEKRQEHVDGVALRSGWGYIKARDAQPEEKRQEHVDGVALRSGWGYIKRTLMGKCEEKRQEHVDGVALRSGWGYIKAREAEPEAKPEEKRQEHVDGVALRSGWGYIKAREEKN